LESSSGETDVDCGGECGQCSDAICPIWPNGHTAHCSNTCRCASGHGDCDNDNHCQSGLVCTLGTFANEQFALPAGTDVCVAPHCTNARQDTANGETGIDCGGPCGNCLWGPGAGKSCDAFDQNLCGPYGDENCCAAPRINSPSSPSFFFRNYDGVFLPQTLDHNAVVSVHNIDKFEVTVGRFRKFVEAFPSWRTAGNPTSGSGNHPTAPSSGWNTAWPLAADEATLRANLKCDPSYQTWTDTAGGNEARPINCVNWYEAFAFCTWDRGRLITEAEHNCAASGGALHRVYPWSSPSTSTTLTQDHANWDCGGNPCSGTPNELLPAGSLPSDSSRWGHLGLSGNVWEWAVDYWVESYAATCGDCALTTADSDWRIIRGGGWASRDPMHLLSGWRDRLFPDERRSDVGLRCVRKF
jgi:formylglycine-generating enzyme required for sulfatase activity